MTNVQKCLFYAVLIALLSSFILCIPDKGASDERGLNIASSQKEKSHRIALVIGNASYENAPLSNPLNDARDMGDMLRKKGFHVILTLDANRRQMINTMREFASELKKGGIGLFYYAGHGMQVKGRNYLIPVKAAITMEEEVALEAVDVNRILGYMDAAKNPLNIVILDACRDNPFTRSFRSMAQGLAQMDAPNGTLIAYATSPGKTAADGSGKNGIYTAHLLKQMEIPGLEIGQMFRVVRKGVRTETNGKQIPWESTSLEGSFFFTQGDNQIILQTPEVEIIEREPEGKFRYLSVNNVNGRHARITSSFIFDVYSCFLKIEDDKTSEWAVTSIDKKLCDPGHRFSFRTNHKNGYWADSDWFVSRSTVVHGKWRDSNKNYGTINGMKLYNEGNDRTEIYSFIHEFKNKNHLSAGTLELNAARTKVIRDVYPPDNEWRIVSFTIDSHDPGKRLAFRTDHKNGYWIEYEWFFSEGAIITGTWIDSNGDTGTTAAAKAKNGF